MENNSNDPEFIKKNFEAIKNRFRQTGAGGVLISQDNTTNVESDSKKNIETLKKGMVSNKGVVTFNPVKQNIPNSRKRNEGSISNTKVFSIGDNKNKKGK